MNLINKIFNRKIAGDTSNIVLPDATGIDNGIEYKSAVNSNVPNGLFNHISDAIQYLQFSVGLYSNTAQYTEGNICKVITKENGHYQIRVFRRNGNNSGSTTANPPIPTTPTTTNGISCYPVENETEWNTDWDECETGLAYWEFKIEGKTITEAVQSFDNRDSVGATWTKASIQELYDSVKNFRVVYFYNCLITTNNIEKVDNIIKGSFSFENIARYTMRFEYNLDASSFTSCSYNVFNYNSSIKELNSDALYNSVKGNILIRSFFENITLTLKEDTNFSSSQSQTFNIKNILGLPDNMSIQGFSLQHTSGRWMLTNNTYSIEYQGGLIYFSKIPKGTFFYKCYTNNSSFYYGFLYNADIGNNRDYALSIGCSAFVGSYLGTSQEGYPHGDFEIVKANGTQSVHHNRPIFFLGDSFTLEVTSYSNTGKFPTIEEIKAVDKTELVKFCGGNAIFNIEVFYYNV